MPGSIVREGEAVGSLALRVDTAALEKLSGWTKSHWPPGQDNEAVGNTWSKGNRFASSYRNSAQALSVVVWKLNDDGSIDTLDTWNDPSANPIERAVVSALGPTRFVVAAIEQVSGHLVLRSFNLNGNDEIILQDTRTDSGVSAEDLSMARVSLKLQLDTLKVALALRLSNGNLKVAVWDIAQADGDLTPNGSQEGATVLDVSVAAPPRPFGLVVTPVITANKEIRTITWSVDDSGNLAQTGSHLLPVNARALASSASGYRRVAVAWDDEVKTSVTHFDLTSEPEVLQRDTIVYDEPDRPERALRLTSGGGSRLYLVGQDQNGFLKIRSLSAIEELQKLDSEGGGPVQSVSAAVLKGSRLVTPVAQTTGGTLKAIAWRDYHVPVVRGVWQDPSCCSNDSPQDNQTTFTFKPARNDVDLGIAVGDHFVITSDKSGVAFFDKAGTPLSSRITIRNLFQPVVLDELDENPPSGPSVLLPPNPQNLLRHLEYQAACDPTLPDEPYGETLFNPCPKNPYDSSVIYHSGLKRFLIVTQFRRAAGGGERSQRLPAIAVSRTEDPRDGFYVYASTESGGMDLPKLDTTDSMAVLTWDGASEHSLRHSAILFNVADLANFVPVPRVTKIARHQIPVGDRAPVSQIGLRTLGLISSDASGSTRDLWSFPETAAGPVMVTHQKLGLPLRLTGGSSIAPRLAARFESKQNGLQEGQLYVAGYAGSSPSDIGLVEFTLRHNPATGDLWNAGSVGRRINCPGQTEAIPLNCRNPTVAVSPERIFLGYGRRWRDGTDPEHYPSLRYTLLENIHTPPRHGLLKQGLTSNADTGWDFDFVTSQVDPEPGGGFWTINSYAKASSWEQVAGRAMPEPDSAYEGEHRLNANPGTVPLGTKFWEKNHVRTTWGSIVSGEFGGDSVPDLFLYDPENAEGSFYTVDSNGMTQLGSTLSDLAPDSIVVSLETHLSNSRRELLFYDWQRGRGEFFETDGNGGLTSVRLHTDWRNTWTLIVSGDFGPQSADELLFYDPTQGELRYNAVSYTGVLTDEHSDYTFGSSVTAIVAGNFHDGYAGDEFFVYDATENTGSFYRFNNGMERITTGGDNGVYTPGRQWSHVMVPNKPRDKLLFYSQTTGEVEVRPVDDGVMGDPSSTDIWDRTWDILVADDFVTSDSGAELLRYARIEE